MNGNSIVSYTAFTSKYKIKTNFLEFYKAVLALLKTVQAKMFSTTQQRTQNQDLWANIISLRKACKTVYKSILEKKVTTPLKSQGKWLSKENIIGNANVNWENTYRLPFLCTTETKLRVFQFMFLPQTNSNKRLPL